MPLNNSDALHLSETTFQLLRDLIEKNTGVYYDWQQVSMLKEKLTPRILALGLDSFLDYYYWLKYDADSTDEWGQLMNIISVPETFFWREFDQIKVLVDVLVPEYFSHGIREPLRIWSAACATGEEPLTIAMALNEKGWFNQGVPIEIYASDGSSRWIDHAKQGLYRERSFRSLPFYLQKKYFQQKDEQTWKIEPMIHQRIQWSQRNLLDETDIRPMATAPFIFCRNVFIYFSPEAIQKTLSIFAKTMPDPGYLFVSASESLLRLTTDFDLEEIQGAFMYKKRS
jgi:chemotaxis protein methyltransferase CheR